MKEVEILLELLEDEKKVLETLKQFNHVGIKNTTDIYLYDELRSQFKLNSNGKLMECLRVRQKGNNAFLTYKLDHYSNEEWLYSDEIEISVSDFKNTLDLLSKIGLNKLVEVNSEKHIYTTDDYEIVFEKVLNLGNFLEVEKLNVSLDDDIFEIKENIRAFISNLKLCVGGELNSGKPELILQRISQK